MTQRPWFTWLLLTLLAWGALAALSAAGPPWTPGPAWLAMLRSAVFPVVSWAAVLAPVAAAGCLLARRWAGPALAILFAVAVAQALVAIVDLAARRLGPPAAIPYQEIHKG